MLGLEMMLKSLGLNPDEIKKSIEDFGAVVVKISMQLDRIENKLDALSNAPDTAETKSIVSEIPQLQIVGE